MQSGELNRLSFYFDADTKAWPMEKSWDEIVPQDWSKVPKLTLKYACNKHTYRFIISMLDGVLYTFGKYYMFHIIRRIVSCCTEVSFYPHWVAS